MSFYLSKIGAILIDPINVLLLLVLAAAISLWLGLRRTSAWLLSISAAVAVVATVLPVGPWLMAALENRFPPPRFSAPPAGIIVLGGAMQPGLARDRDALAINASVERLVAFAALARRYPDVRLVYTGGTGSLLEPELREADSAKAFLTTLGLDVERITFERGSRNTFENAVFTRRLIRPSADQRWLLVTSARHMPRAVGAFRQAGWGVVAYPVDYTSRRAPSLWRNVTFASRLNALGAALHEWTGLVFYYATGRSSALFPGPKAVMTGAPAEISFPY